MMLYLVTYSNKKYFNANRLLLKSAKKCKFNHIFNYNPNDIDKKFVNQNIKILAENRGDGYWLWKPYIINKVINKIPQNSILVYCDSGLYFKKNIKKLLTIFNNNKLNIMAFCHGRFKILEWTKRDLLNEFQVSKKELINEPQYIAGFEIFRVNKFSKKFVNEWLKLSQNYNLISDCDSIAKNYPEFIEHRHDQSIFTLLCKKYKIEGYRDPTEFGNYQRYAYKNEILKKSKYPQILWAHKNGNATSYFSILKVLFTRRKEWLKYIIKNKRIVSFYKWNDICVYQYFRK